MFEWARRKDKDRQLTAETREMLENVLEFSDKTAEDVSVHRRDMVALNVNAPKNDIVRSLLELRYSRFPVYEGSVDNIVGILNAKDAFRSLLTPEGALNDDFDVKAILRKPYFVPISKGAGVLFEEMRKNKQHMAVVVDEYGGTAGLVTMEDLIEEITGNILDEYDEEEKPPIRHIAENKYIVEGKTPLDDLAELFETRLPSDEFDTVGGFVVGLLGRVPSDGEKPEINYENLIFKVTDMKNNRIHDLTVEKNDGES